MPTPQEIHSLWNRHLACSNSDLITEMPNCYYQAPWIEVEAKFKELAIEKLRAEWLSANVPQFSNVS